MQPVPTTTETPTFESPLLAAMGASERAELFQRAVRRRLDRGDRLYIADHPSERAHIVVTGVLKLMGRIADGRESIFGLAVSGDLIGEIAALDRGPQPLDAVAVTRAEVLGVDAKLLTTLAAANRESALVLAQVVAVRARSAYETALDRSGVTAEPRVAARLLELGRILGHEHQAQVRLRMPFSQADLAAMAGICRESACRTLRRFKKRGLVDYRGREMRLLRPDLLEAIRCEGRGAGPSR